MKRADAYDALVGGQLVPTEALTYERRWMVPTYFQWTTPPDRLRRPGAAGPANALRSAKGTRGRNEGETGPRAPNWISCWQLAAPVLGLRIGVVSTSG